MDISDDRTVQITRSICRMIWANKKVTLFHKKRLFLNSSTIPRVLLDENCSSKEIISGIRKLGWNVRLVQYAEIGLSDKIVLTLFDDWRPHLFITYDKHFAEYDRFCSYYEGMIDENGQLERWLPIIYILPSRLSKNTYKTAQHIQERMNSFYFAWEDYKGYNRQIKCFNFEIITVRGEKNSYKNNHAPFKKNVFSDTVEIDLSGENLTFIGLSPFPKFLNLKKLNLASNDIDTLDISPLVKCVNLEFLIIDKTVLLKMNEETRKVKLPIGLEKLKGERNF